MLTGISARLVRYIIIASFIVAAFYVLSSPTQPYTVPLRTDAPYIRGSTGSRLQGNGANLVEKAAGNLADASPGLSMTEHGSRVNATFVTLARNVDVWDLARSIRQVEDRFNRRFHYDWVFLNDKPFDETFRNVTTALVSGTAHYGQIPKEHWSVPDWIDEKKAAEARTKMENRRILYGESVSYRHMCRFESGFFALHPLMQNYKFYWRVEPSIELFCDIPEDPFRFMSESDKKYGFVISLLELAETVPTLWDSAKKFVQNYPQHIAANNSIAFLSDDDGESYNLCHFWSNFEIGSLDWMRSQAYTDFFNSLDRDGGFFYERWGDAPIHSIAAGLLLNKTDIHFFDNIAYFHMPFTHCPNNAQARIDLKCHCNPEDNFDWNQFSCLSRFYDINGLEKPESSDD